MAEPPARARLPGPALIAAAATAAEPAAPWRDPVAAMLVSALSFSLMGVCVKQVGSRIPAAEVVLVRALLNVMLSWWLVRRAGINPWGHRRGLLIVRGAIGSVALLCVYVALAELPLAAATLLQYLYPTFTAVLAWLMLGERISGRVLLAVLLSWGGVVLMAGRGFGFGGSAALPAAPVCIAIGGALATALAYVSVRSLARSEHPLVIVFYFPLVAVPLSLPLVLLDPVIPTAVELLWLLGVGLFTQLGQVALTRSLIALPAARATAISTVQVVFAAFWGWLIFNEALGVRTLAGALLILAGTLFSLSGRRRGEADR